MKDKLVFIDTNILIYCYSSTEPVKQQTAIQIAENNSAFVSTQVLNELSNVLLRKFNQPHSVVAKAIIEVASNFNVHDVSTENIIAALLLSEKYKLSYYDSVIVSTALMCNCSILYTEDMQHGMVINDVLTVINPFIT